MSCHSKWFYINKAKKRTPRHRSGSRHGKSNPYSEELFGIPLFEKLISKKLKGPERFLKLYQPKYFGEGWRTEILEPGLDRNKLPDA